MIPTENKNLIGLKEIKQTLFEQIAEKELLTEKEKQEAQNWDYIKHEIGKQLIKHIKGRPTPVRRGRVTPHRDALRLIPRTPPYPTYPKTLKTDTQKHKYLKKLLETNQINKEIYTDLKSVLRLKKEAKQK